MVYGQMNEPPGNRLRVALTGLTMAEYFRDEKTKTVKTVTYYCSSTTSSYTLAGTEISALLGRIPSRWVINRHLQRNGCSSRRITSTKIWFDHIDPLYCTADDLTDPSPATTFAHLDATVVLSRDIASSGILPAIDPLDSTKSD